MDETGQTRIRLLYLKDWRLSRFLSQRELEKVSGVSFATISRLEKGHQQAKRLTAAKLAKGLGIRRQQLLTPPDTEILTLIIPMRALMVGKPDAPEEG